MSVLRLNLTVLGPAMLRRRKVPYHKMDSENGFLLFCADKLAKASGKQPFSPGYFLRRKYLSVGWLVIKTVFFG